MSGVTQKLEVRDDRMKDSLEKLNIVKKILFLLGRPMKFLSCILTDVADCQTWLVANSAVSLW